MKGSHSHTARRYQACSGSDCGVAVAVDGLVDGLDAVGVEYVVVVAVVADADAALAVVVVVAGSAPAAVVAGSVEARLLLVTNLPSHSSAPQFEPFS